MKRLLIVFHSMTGGTRQMAHAAAQGALQTREVHVDLVQARDAGHESVVTADGYLFATPENLAAISGVMKDFFDRTYYQVIERIVGRPYAVLVCAGSDGSNAAAQIRRIATGWRLRAISEPVIVCTHAQTADAILAPKVIPPEDLRRCEELGAAFATGLAMGIY